MSYSEDDLKKFHEAKDKLCDFLTKEKIELHVGVTAMISICATICASSDDKEAQTSLEGAIELFKKFHKESCENLKNANY